MPRNENTDTTTDTDLHNELSTSFVRDTAVGARRADRDHVLAPGCKEPQSRPGGGYMDY